MNLKRLQENSAWRKLPELDFKNKMIEFVLSQNETDEKTSNNITKLEEEIQSLKKQLGVVSLQNTKLNQKINFIREADNGNAHT